MNLSKFAPNLAETTQPMRELLIKDSQWTWGEAHGDSLQEDKGDVDQESYIPSHCLTRISKPLFQQMHPRMGAVLLQKQTSGENKPVAYISRSMTSTEQKYAQIEKEALIVFYLGV